MSKIIFSLSLIICLSVVVFGQSYEGFYQARFISLDRNINPTAEFEIQSNGAVIGKILVNGSATAIRGSIDSYGTLEAVSGSESWTNYKLKADMRRGGKITLTSRTETKSVGNQANSQMFMQGSYSKIANPVAPVSANKYSELTIEQPNPLFEKSFSSSSAEVIVGKNGSFTVFHLQMMGGGENTERGFYFSVARAPDSTQKIWKVDNIRGMNYVEKTENYTKINRFRIDYEKWLKNRDAASGEIELISENSNQMVFKINNLRIKNEASNDFVTINGIVYAKINK